MEQQSRYRSPGADLAGRVLGLLSRYRTRASTLSEVAAELDVAKTTCLRVLRTLQAHGLLDYDEITRCYRLGEYAVVIGARAEEGMDVLQRVRPLLARAARNTGLTAAFVARTGQDRMMYVAKQEAPGSAGVSVSVGNRFPITSTSYGKWVVAFADDEERARLLGPGLAGMTDQTVTDPAAYLRSVEGLRHAELLESYGEYVAGVYAVSCAVIDRRHELAGVLVVLGVLAALDEQRREAVRAHMRVIAAECTADVPSRPAPATPGRGDAG